MRPIPLDRPCDADWSAMGPVPGGRFCDGCRKTVHDLSSMSPEEARALLASSGSGELCVRYLHEPGGRVLHRGEEVGARPLIPMRALVRRRWAALAGIAGIATASVVLEACGGARARHDYTPHRLDDEGPDAGVAPGAPAGSER